MRYNTDMSFQNTDALELQVKSFFDINNLNISKIKTIGVAVSGGADSICLLTAIFNLFGSLKTVKVITVNHNIRPEEQTCGDADYVEQYCKRINVKCCRVEIPRGYIKDLAKKRNQGIEEAARFERYRAFELFIDQENIDYLCLAHNQNDQIETVIMRFLSGSSISGLSGIPPVRNKYIRPLYNVSRSQIEEYLFKRKIKYKTDLTNFDTAMYRNTVRNILMPVLKQNFEGYEKSLILLSKKARDDELFINKQCDAVFPLLGYKENLEDENVEIVLDYNAFYKLDNAIKRRLLYRFIETIGPKERIPFSFIDRIISKKSSDIKWIEESSGIVIEVYENRFFIHKKVKIATEQGFFVIIKGDGDYKAGNLSLTVSMDKDNNQCSLSLCYDKKNTLIKIGGLEYPFVIRSVQSGDVISAVDGSKKSLSKIITDWHGGKDRDNFIVVQCLATPKQDIKAFLGSFLDYQDWIVK